MAKENNKLIVSIFSLAIFLLLLLLLLGTCNNNKEYSSSERFNNNNNNMNMNNRYNRKEESYNNYKELEGFGTNAIMQPLSQVQEQVPNMVENFADANQDAKEEEVNFGKDRLTAKDLLPNDANSKWAQLNPAVGGDVSDQNFLTSGYHIGINTVGQSLRNANLQLRNEPINPQQPVSPWLISTIEPDIRSRGLMDIGSSSEY
jgi:hypothetical protein